ncbi:MAG: 50S ribosomal protein L4 [Planctomycetes bacterium]|nr:50S ribosomal protein L4 [Planctomycetota bacterium]
MIDVPVYNMSGEQTGTVQIDENSLGRTVRHDLLKQAVVMWRTNQRQGSARTKNRSMVEGSTRKLYRQKGTGNARMGTVRTGIRRGGGRAHAKRERNYRQEMPKRMRQLARCSALLAKLKARAVAVVDPLSLAEPKTKVFHGMLKKIGADRGCVVALARPDEMVYRSGRNIPKTEIMPVYDLNAYEILRRRKVVFTQEAFQTVVANPLSFRANGETE